MKTIVCKAALFTTIFFSTYNLFSQDFQGLAYYQTKTTVDMENFGGQQMSEQQKKMIAERMKSMLEKVCVLNFNRSESIYEEEEKLDAPGAGGRGWRSMGGGMLSGNVYKDIKAKQMLQAQEIFGKQFLIKDSLPKLDWKMENESKQIGQYTVFKATAIKEVDETDFSNIRRRNRGEEADSEKKSDTSKTENPLGDFEVPKTILVTAWYTPQVPVNQGPAEYWGLPGLILEVNAGRTTMLCTKIVLNPDDKIEIEQPNKGEEVTRAEYNAIVKQKMQEMREMYRGRGGRGRNNN